MGDDTAREPREKTPRTAAPMLAELDTQLLVFERAAARSAQGFAVVGICMAAYVGFFIASDMGRALGIACIVALAWFSIVHALLVRGRAQRLLGWLNPAFELAVPGIALVLLARTQGAAYALGSWVPPLLFALLVMFSTVRLKPALPMTMGLLGAVEYLAVYATVLRTAPMGGHLDEALYRPTMQAVRAVSIVVFGAIGMFASAGLRRAVGQAARQTRAKDLFGKYRIGERIASGGMGTVYAALYCPEGGFERKVAVKRIHPHLVQDTRFVDGFRHEAELCARLAHPNIVAVFDFGIVEDTYFLAMEFVEGMDLLRVRKRCKAAGIAMPPALVALVGREICEGLAYAHERALDAGGRPLRVVHRDLNPSNVLVSRLGQVKISDFGVAKALGDSKSHETKNFVGKMPYLAPEQARGEAFDARVDLFSLGLVLWELLCLRPVFQRESDAQTLLSVMNTVAPAPSTLRAELAGGPWDAFSAKALEPDAGARFQSAREMGAALDALCAHEGMPRAEALAAFLAEVEAAPDLPSADPMTETKNDLDPPTVKESG
jgi:eukaryotic-like serine/threonine-protein kinase